MEKPKRAACGLTFAMIGRLAAAKRRRFGLPTHRIESRSIRRIIWRCSEDGSMQMRNERARPLLDDLQRWFTSCLTKLSKKSDVTVAIHYALGRWTPLLRYCDDGALEIDNNAAERALRAVALGRKNYLFAGSNAGGERAAAMYTLIGSAKLNRIDPEAYLSHALARIADHPINRIEELLPWNVSIFRTDHETAA